MEDWFKLIIGLFVLMCVFDTDRRIKSLEKQFFEDQFKSWHDR